MPNQKPQMKINLFWLSFALFIGLSLWSMIILSIAYLFNIKTFLS